MKLYQNFIINEAARAMTKGEHTYVLTGHSPSTTLLCEGIIIKQSERKNNWIYIKPTHENKKTLKQAI